MHKKDKNKRKFPIKDRQKTKEKKKKFPIKDQKKTKEKESSRSKIRRKQKGILQKGLQTRQYDNKHTKLSRARKKRKKTTIGSGPLPLITDRGRTRIK